MKTVLITGATGGIGKAIVRAFKGYNVVIHYHKNGQEAKNLLKEVTGISVRADVSKPDEVEEMFSAARKAFNKIDILINNAGVQDINMLCDTTLEDWNRIMGINLTGAYNTAKCALEDMMYSGGKIINISSIWGQTGGSMEAMYSASKAGLIGFTKALAKEYSNININCICPGVIETEMNKHLSEEERESLLGEIPLGRFGSPEDIAEMCLFLAEKGNYITGQVIGINGGMYI